MFRLNFYKDENNKWFVSLPEWLGSKDELEMVMGADTMLDILSQGEDSVFVYLSETPFENANQLTFVRNADEFENGAFYHLETIDQIELNLSVWLCDVTLFVLGHFPKIIYFQKSWS